ncbi:MAG: hypothetical protein K6G81_11345 [Lachnospiraceae bacterium]|nr:hypothetical protein [Lachnospiraceae bacterium]
MIAASYFSKAPCSTKLVERNMFLHYKEQRVKKQYEMEDICISYMDKLERKLGAAGLFAE